MSVDTKESMRALRGLKADWDSRVPLFRNKVSEMYGSGQSGGNPFLDKNGNVFNPYMNYDNILNSPNISDRAKQLVTQALGVSPTSEQATENISQSKNGNSSGGSGLFLSSGASSKTSSGTKTNTSSGTKTNTNSSTGSKTPIQSSSNIVNAAQKYLGTPYVWGGESMAEGGMDCSGFVYNALKDSGHDIGRTTAEGYRQKGTSVSKENLQPGDLVFYGSGKATHVAIYMGNGKVIQSSGNSNNTKSNPGTGVTIKDLNYRNDYLGAKRY